MARMNEGAVDIKAQKIVEQAYEVVELVKSAYGQGTAIHKVEEGLFGTLLKLGYQAVEWLLSSLVAVIWASRWSYRTDRW